MSYGTGKAVPAISTVEVVTRSNKLDGALRSSTLNSPRHAETSGVTKLVPLRTCVPPPIAAERTEVPGAATSVSRLTFEKDARDGRAWLAAIATSVTHAGKLIPLESPWLPAAATTKTECAWRSQLTARVCATTGAPSGTSHSPGNRMPEATLIDVRAEGVDVVERCQNLAE